MPWFHIYQGCIAMVPTLFFYQLVLSVLLCRLLAGGRTFKSAYPYALAPECLNQLPSVYR